VLCKGHDKEEKETMSGKTSQGLVYGHEDFAAHLSKKCLKAEKRQAKQERDPPLFSGLFLVLTKCILSTDFCGLVRLRKIFFR
jgi:hypothetical protein